MQNKPNVLFVNLPTIPYKEIIKSLKKEQHIPQRTAMLMGILYISAYLKKYNVFVGKIGIVDYILSLRDISNFQNVEDFLLKVAKDSVSFSPDILAFSLNFSTSHRIFIICLEILKSIWPNTIVVVGGTHATSAVSQILNNSHVDYLIRGEGEIAFSDFVTQYVKGLPISIKGVYSKNNIVDSSTLETTDFVENLDDLPFPDWELINMKIYATQIANSREFGNSNKKVATIITTRGCPNKCTFCSTHIVHGRKIRYRSVENVVDEVKQLYERFGITLFDPEDDMFTIPKKRCIELLNALDELNIPEFEIQNQDGYSVNALDNDIIDAMLKIGIRLFNLAVESGSEYVQRHIIHKYVKLHRVKEIIDYIRSKNNNTIIRCYFILGFFGETKEQMKETIRFAKSIGADWCLFSVATPLIGTKMHQQMLDAGYIDNSSYFWEKASFGQRCFDTPQISGKELEELAYSANLDVNFINNINIKNKNYQKAITIFKDIVRVYQYHIVAWFCIMKCYKKLNNKKKADETKKKIDFLIKKDNRSLEMFQKYKHLMSGYKFDN